MHIKLEKLLDKIVNELKSVNEKIEYYKDYPDYEINLPKCKLNIPFLVAPLIQSFEENKYNTYNELIEDLTNYSANVSYESKYKVDYYSPCNLTITFHDSNSDNCCDGYTDFSYTISCGVDERPWGYCECTKENIDYREDKDCCGHGCDWTAPSVSITKNINVSNHSWSGDEHDYWIFEDNYYSKDKVSSEDKEKKEKELKIEQLRREIAESEELLRKLLVS